MSDQIVIRNATMRPRRFAPEAGVIILWRVAILACLLILWDYGARALGDLFIAGPFEVLRRIWDITISGELWRHAEATLIVTTAGFAVGWLGGTVLPLLLARSAMATRSIEPYVLASMGIPAFTLTSLLVLWFGIGFAPKIVIVAIVVFYVFFINTFSGLRSMDTRLSAMAAVQGASPWQVTRHVTWPWMRGFIFSGLKIAIPRAVSAAIVGEFLVADRGLGYYIEYARQSGDTVGVFTGIVLVTLLVMLINAALTRWHDRVMVWRPGVGSAM